MVQHHELRVRAPQPRNLFVVLVMQAPTLREPRGSSDRYSDRRCDRGNRVTGGQESGRRLSTSFASDIRPGHTDSKTQCSCLFRRSTESICERLCAQVSICVLSCQMELSNNSANFESGRRRCRLAWRRST